MGIDEHGGHGAWMKIYRSRISLIKSNVHWNRNTEFSLCGFLNEPIEWPHRWIRSVHNAYMLGQFRNWIYSDTTVGRTEISANLRRNKSESNDHLSRVKFVRVQTPNGNLWDAIFTCICERTNWSSWEANDIKSIIRFHRNLSYFPARGWTWNGNANTHAHRIDGSIESQ